MLTLACPCTASLSQDRRPTFNNDATQTNKFTNNRN